MESRSLLPELPHLHTAWDVDRRIVLDSADKLVLIRFSSYEQPPTEVLLPYIRANDASPIKRARLDDGVVAAVDAQSATKKGRRAGAPGSSSSPPAAVTTSATVEAVAGMEHYVSTQHMDELLRRLIPKVCKYCIVYAVDTNEVTEFNEMYELGHERDPFAVMFFFRNRHIRVDVGTGNNNKINFFAFEDVDDFVPIVDAAFRAGKQGLTMASSDRKFSTVSLRR